MSIEFIDCGPESVGAVRTFFGRVYRADYPLAASPQLFDWQFGRRDDAAGYCCKVALVNGEIAGCLGYLPVEVSVSGRLVRGAWTANWIVDTHYRRLGLGPLLMRELTRGVDVTLVVGLSDDSRAILPRMGWTDFGDLTRYVKVLDAQAVGALFEDGTPEWPDEQARNTPPENSEISVQRVDRFERTVATLWDAAWGRSAAGTRRSAEFLNWRYADHPAFTYRLFEAHREQLRGFAVYRVENVRDLPVRIGRLVEFFAAPDVSQALIATVLDDARAQGVSAMDFFCSQSQSRVAPLLECGFLPGSHPAAARLPILFQPVDRRRGGIPFMAYLNNLPQGARELEWYVTKGDGDQDRPN